MAFALITGASAGIGRELARLFAANGHDLVLVARRKERLDELAAELSAKGRTVHVVAADLSTVEGPQAVLQFVRNADIAVEFLVNNAGVGSNGKFWELDIAKELAQVNLNITALMTLTHGLMPTMVARGRGRILNLGSTAGFQPGPLMATYFASKAFVNSFTEALANELAGTGVTATVSCPGPVATEFADTAGIGGNKLFASAVAPASEIAAEAYAAMMCGKTVYVHGARFKALAALGKITPRSVATKIARRLNQPS